MTPPIGVDGSVKDEVTRHALSLRWKAKMESASGSTAGRAAPNALIVTPVRPDSEVGQFPHSAAIEQSRLANKHTFESIRIEQVVH